MLMRANIILDIRPPRPPVFDKVAEEYDRFHPAMKDPTSLVLDNATMDSFAIAKVIVEERLKCGDGSIQPGDDVVVVPLGTSSALPSKYRNGTCSILHD